MDRDTRRVLAKYLLIEIPGWVVAAGVLWAAARWWALSPTLAAILFALWVVKDFALFPVLRIAYEDGPPRGADALVGMVGRVEKALAPEGLVRIGAELWRARAPSGRSLPEDAEVQVRAVRGLLLLVDVAGADADTAGPVGGSPR